MKGKGRGEPHFDGRVRAALARENADPKAEVVRRALQAQQLAAQRGQQDRDREDGR